MSSKKGSRSTWRTQLRDWWHHRWVRILTYIAIVFGVIMAMIGFLNAFVFTPIKDPDYGVSFSVKEARKLDVDWKANFTALLDDLGFTRLRLMSYWDESEDVRGTLNFADLDWQFAEAAKRGVKVSLAVGLRQPRWPECHQPTWADSLTGNAWKQALYAYMEAVVKRYKDHPALDTYQLENEGMNNWFGKCDAPDRERLIEEFNLMKKWDPNHKVIMSLSDQHGYPIGQPVPDIYGFSIYRVVWNDKIPPAGYITYPTPIWYHRMRAAIITAYSHKPIIIHELQMEPWGPVDFKDLSIDEQNKSMSLDQIGKNFKFARQTGIREMYLWGGEWWYWRKVGGDPTVWERVRAELQNP
jgi:hypothetical protein